MNFKATKKLYWFKYLIHILMTVVFVVNILACSFKKRRGNSRYRDKCNKPEKIKLLYLYNYHHKS
ncbi:MAG: hypothetical protein ACTSWN_06170 [Promethearchaeota archaeon]